MGLILSWKRQLVKQIMDQVALRAIYKKIINQVKKLESTGMDGSHIPVNSNEWGHYFV